LKDLNELHALNLSNTLVSDEGIVHLKKLSLLRMLALDATRVSIKGKAELKKMLPALSFGFYPD
jgi:hypothetical protein